MAATQGTLRGWAYFYRARSQVGLPPEGGSYHGGRQHDHGGKGFVEEADRAQTRMLKQMAQHKGQAVEHLTTLCERITMC